MPVEKQDKLPLDAILLSDAVIELNISKRCVGLYPHDHPIVKGSIERAFAFLQKLFELRSDITLGIAEDTLVVDEYTLDRKNPVFKEFAYSLHAKGIAAITFSAGLLKEELIGLHGLLTTKETPFGKDLVEYAKNKDLRHIALSPIDFSNFGFVQGGHKVGGTDINIWEEYVFGLLEGKLSSSEGEEILNIPPEDVACYINNAMTENSGQETYDRVITAYLKKKGEARLSTEAFNKFLSFVENLSPDLKRRFLSRSFVHFSEDMDEVERVIGSMTPENFQRIIESFTEYSTMIPDTLKMLMDKLADIKEQSGVETGFFIGNAAVVHDIEIGEDIMKLFEQKNFHAFMSDKYKKQLEIMLGTTKGKGTKVNDLLSECREDLTDNAVLNIMLELLDAGFFGKDDYQKLFERISEFTALFLETGRFNGMLRIYNTISSGAFNEKCSDEAINSIRGRFHSAEFLTDLISTFRIWGRKEREGAVNLSKALDPYIIDPMLYALAEETDASLRKFLLSVLAAVGDNVCSYAIKRLDDARWYVVRNILYLIRECNGHAYAADIRKLARHRNINICLEAVKTLLHFKTPDSVSFLKLHLQSEDTELRKGAVNLAGAYKISEAVPYLVRLLEKKDIFGAESYYKIDVVDALGEIGDKAAVEHLLKIYNTKSLLYKGNLENLKLEIFKTLVNYPPDSVQKMLELGLASGNEKIRAISRKLLDRADKL
jgi:hypothetical protein